MENLVKKELLSIGKMAKVNRVTVATLRLYDEMGLLTPVHTDEESGYRYYDIRQSSRLDFIRYMRDLGLSLEDVRELLIKGDITLIEDKLIQRHHSVHEQLRELVAAHDAIERTINSIERFRKSPQSGTISLEYIDKRYILCIPCEEDFYRCGISSYEQSIHRLRSELTERKLPQLLSYSLGTSVKQADFEKGCCVADKVFIFGDHKLLDYGGDIQILESGMYACIYLDNFDEEMHCASKLLEYCRSNGYIISGDYICEELTEFNIFSESQRSMFLRLQVPVKFQKKS